MFIAGCSNTTGGEVTTLSDEEIVASFMESGECVYDFDDDGEDEKVKIIEPEPGYNTEIELYDANGTLLFIKDDWTRNFEGIVRYSDSERDYVFMRFETGAQGGMGSYDFIMVFNDSLVPSSLGFEPLYDVDAEYMLDGIYYISTEEYEGEDVLHVRQYMSDDGHSDAVGDVVSNVYIDPDTGMFIANESWLEEETDYSY